MRGARLALAVAVVLIGTAATPAPPHNLHVAHTRMVIEGDAAVARIRIFRDDLEKSLKQPIKDTEASKAMVADYVAKRVLLTADGVALSGAVLDSGADMDGDQAIWWLLIQWKAAKPMKTVGLRVHVLFDLFKDQQNIVQVAHNPGDERRGLYFQPGDLKEQVLKF